MTFTIDAPIRLTIERNFGIPIILHTYIEIRRAVFVCGQGVSSEIAKCRSWFLGTNNHHRTLNPDIAVLMRNGDLAGWESVVRYWTEEERWQGAVNSS
jgi:hypothetical protein